MEYIAGRMEKGRKILIRGNHDKGVTDSKFRRLGFDPHRIYQYEMFVLTHEPISASNMAHLNHHGIMGNIHGHTHGVETGL
ncbi:hypothetical protein, partial [Klebsiella pneumoniae]|uniref:hypothetical protein n=1 Tax=Klebsiella pneumoniae TaxID=573 RepID=UPI003B97E6F2